MGTFTATPKNDASPPYVELQYDSGNNNVAAIGAQITRDGVPVRVPYTVPSPARVTTWKDYDAPFDQTVTYVFSLQDRQAPTGGTSENWQGTLTSKGWSSVAGDALDQTTTYNFRTNLVGKPSFQDTLGSWTAVGDATIALSSDRGYLGTKSLKVTPTPTTITNLVSNDPTFSLAGSSGWVAGSGASTAANSSGKLHVTGTNAAGRVYGTSPEIAVTAGVRYWFGIEVMRYNSIGAGDTGFLWRWYNSSHVQIDTDHETVASIADDATRSFSTNTVAPAGAAYLRLFAFTTKTFSSGLGQYFGDVVVDNFYVNNGNAGFFSGASTDTSTIQYDWTSTTNASTSTRKVKVLNAGATFPITNMTPGSRHVLSAYFYGVSGGGAKATAQVSGTGLTIVGTQTAVTETNAWQRVNVMFDVPATTTSMSITINFDNLGVTGDRYIDAVLLEVGDALRPYFDGANSEIPTSTLGTWTTAWSAGAESVSYARFGTSVTSGAMKRTFNMASSGIDLFSFVGAASSFGTNSILVTFSNGATLTYTITPGTSSVEHRIATASAFATMTRYGSSGPMSLVFQNNTISLSSPETGQSISVPLTNTFIVSTVQVTAGSAGAVGPFTVQPGVVLTSDSGSAVATLEPDGAWLYHPYDPSLSLKIDTPDQACPDAYATAESARELTRETVTSLLTPVGSKRGIAISLGARKDPSWDLELASKTAEAYDAVVGLFDDASPVRFDYPDSLGESAALCFKGMRIPKGWFSPGDVTEARDREDWRSPQRRWGVPLSPVRAPSAYPGT